jgi:hypothetical protein
VRNENSPPSNKYPKCLLERASILAPHRLEAIAKKTFSMFHQAERKFSHRSLAALLNILHFTIRAGDFMFDSSEVKIAAAKKIRKKNINFCLSGFS